MCGRLRDLDQEVCVHGSDKVSHQRWLGGEICEGEKQVSFVHPLTLCTSPTFPPPGALREAGIPFIQGDSAMFCWIDLRSGLLPSKADAAAGDGGADWAAEEELWEELWQKHGVLLTPGGSTWAVHALGAHGGVCGQWLQCGWLGCGAAAGG